MIVKVRSLESVPFSRYFCFCNILHIITSGPSLIIESINSMTIVEHIGINTQHAMFHRAHPRNDYIYIDYWRMTSLQIKHVYVYIQCYSPARYVWL